MIITISGESGSGKSTIAKMIAKKLDLKHYSAGDLQREYAKEKGLTIKELGDLEAKDPAIDKEVDNKTKVLANQDGFVMDGWIAGHFLPRSVKVFLKCDIDEAARRITGDKREAEEFSDTKEAKKTILDKEEVNRERWIRYYDFDFKAECNYDIVVDTTKLTREEVVEEIISRIPE